MKCRPLLACFAVVFATCAMAEDGYDLWLRYPAAEPAAAAVITAHARELVADDASPTLAAAREELTRALTSLTGRPPVVVGSPTQSGALIVGTARTPLIA